jgi:uncharacterized cupredoxin-like copper-binding protein
MSTMKRSSALSLMVALAACGGGEPAQTPPAEQPAAAAPATAAAPTLGEMTMPDWFHADDAGKTIHMTITAGATDLKNYWNFNGYTDGNMAITVPVGYSVMIDLVNKDPAMAHSLGVSTVTENFAVVDPATVAFPGAITANPASMTEATLPGETESITFTAATAGSYTMLCFIPGHSAVGMWVHFNVSADGTKGVQTAM